MEGAKEGVFEWIIGYEDIHKYFSREFTGITRSNDTLKVLEIGCGTSNLSELLSSRLNFGEVVSIDNDTECINHMRSLHSESTNLSWFTYDMIEDRGKPQGNCLDIDGYFDIVVDKGTFDAIHVEGSVSPLLEEVHRLLSVGGVYILCSINSRDYLQPLLCIDELPFDVQVHELNLSQFKVATVLICKKINDNKINSESLAAQEKEVADAYFKEQKPLLTPEFEAFIRKGYKEQAANGWLSVSEAHQLMFESEYFLDEFLFGYSLEMFWGDLIAFPLQNGDYMNVEEAIAFIKAMQ